MKDNYELRIRKCGASVETSRRISFAEFFAKIKYTELLTRNS